MIGIFDSGSGGLTVLRAIRDRLPSADVLYYGDIKNAPYGSKSREELSVLTVKAIELLQKEGAQALVSACNSVSASLAVSILDALAIAPQHLIEMVGPTVRYFRDSRARIVLCATPATIRSGIYQNAFHMIGKDVMTIAIKDLASAIEFGEPQEKIKEIITAAFASIPPDSFDVLILACTHYPLVSNMFAEVLPHTPIFDPAEAVAERVESQMWPREAGDGVMRCITSKDSEPFRRLVARLFPHEKYSIEVIE